MGCKFITKIIMYSKKIVADEAQYYFPHIFIISKYILIISTSEEFFNSLCVFLYYKIIHSHCRKLEKYRNV